MAVTRRKQTLTAFNQNSAETVDRLNATDEAEVLTVNGEDRVVLLSPAAFDALSADHQLSVDVETIRRSMQQIDAGECCEATEFFDRLRQQLSAMAHR